MNYWSFKATFKIYHNYEKWENYEYLLFLDFDQDHSGDVSGASGDQKIWNIIDISDPEASGKNSKN